MSKTKAIAVTVVSVGMVAVAGVAGFAVVSSTNASAPTETITLLADENPVASGPNFVPGELPAIVTPDAGAASTTAPEPAKSTETSTQSSNSQTSTSNSGSVAVQPKTTTVTTPSEITSLQARTAVLNEVNGTVTSVTEVSHNGFEAFAVKVALTDGGIATGYVHKKSGVIFDWDVVGAPAAPSNGGAAQAPAVPSTTSHKEDDHKESEHKSPEQKRPSSSHDEDDD